MVLGLLVNSRAVVIRSRRAIIFLVTLFERHADRAQAFSFEILRPSVLIAYWTKVVRGNGKCPDLDHGKRVVVAPPAHEVASDVDEEDVCQLKFNFLLIFSRQTDSRTTIATASGWVMSGKHNV
jgi:hypothetical protein